jgi:hypothetical protein
MRTLGFRTHVILALAAAAGLVLSLSRPWYALAPPKQVEETADIGDINGPLTGFLESLKRWASSPDGTTGWDSLDHWGMALAAMAGVAALGVLMLLVPFLQQLGRDFVRYASFAAMAIAAWKLIDPPGSNAAYELRNGALAAAGFAVMLFTCGSAAASAPLRRRVPPHSFVPPPPPPVFGSSGPPGN